jgi:hypothetical protein
MAITTHSVLASTGFALLVIAKIQQSGELWIRDRDDVTTGAAIATVGSAATHELFAMKADATAPAIAADGPYFCLIDKFHWRLKPEAERQIRTRLTSGFKISLVCLLKNSDPGCSKRLRGEARKRNGVLE